MPFIFKSINVLSIALLYYSSSSNDCFLEDAVNDVAIVTCVHAFEGAEYSLQNENAERGRRANWKTEGVISGNDDDDLNEFIDDGDYEYDDDYDQNRKRVRFKNSENDDEDVREVAVARADEDEDDGEMIFKRSAHGVKLIDASIEREMRKRHGEIDENEKGKYSFVWQDREGKREQHSSIGPLLPRRFDSFGNQLTIDEVRRGFGVSEEEFRNERNKGDDRLWSLNFTQGDVRALDKKKRVPRVSMAKARRKTLRWTKKANDLVLAEIRNLQFPENCDEQKLLIVPMEQCPLGCRLHILLQRALVMATTLNRTLVFLPPWDDGLEHLFMPLTKCTLRMGRDNSPKKESRKKLATAIEVLGPVMFPRTAHGAPHEKINKFVQVVREAMDERSGNWRAISNMEKIEIITDKVQKLIEQTVSDSNGKIVMTDSMENVVNAAMTFIMHLVPGEIFPREEGEAPIELLDDYIDAAICHNGRCDGWVDVDNSFPIEVLAKSTQVPLSMWRKIRSELSAGIRSKENNEISEELWNKKREEFQMKIGNRGIENLETKGKTVERFLIRQYNPFENLPLPGTRDDDEYSKEYDVIPYDPPRVNAHSLDLEFGCNDFTSACQAHFMYMSMLTSSVVLRPTKETAQMLSERYFENLHAVQAPTVVLQIRQSDKKGEDPYYNVFGGYRAVSRYIAYLKDLAESTKKCWKTLFIMSDSGQVIKEVRQRHERGEILLCGKKPVLIFSKHAQEHDILVPVFAWSLRDEKNQASKSSSESPFTRERLFVAELLLAAKIGDFVLGDGSSNIFLTLLELIAHRKRIADLPQLIKYGKIKESIEKYDETYSKNLAQTRCENFDMASNACAWVCSIACAPFLGWSSVTLNQPYVNGMPPVLEYARVHRDDWLEELL